MPGKRPRVSIGLPVYNGEKYLACALDSLLNQTFTDFEIVISDNASTDRTVEICEEYAARDDRIRVVRQQENLGAVGNFNRVFELSQGEYFKWAAYDDICSPELIARCVEVLDHDKSVVCCHAKSLPIDANGLRIEFPQPMTGRHDKGRAGGVAGDPRNASSPLQHTRFRDVLMNSGFGVRCYGLIRSEKLRRTGMLLPIYGYEKIMMAELSLLGRFHLIPAPLFFQRVHVDASASLTSLAEQQKFFAPQSAVRRTYPRLQYLRGYLRAVHRLSRSNMDRMYCYLWIVAYLAQVRKWKRVFLGTLKGKGTGGANAKLLVSRNSASRSST
jgi:glycosyltransferase involved in cell wall biosynthesis